MFHRRQVVTRQSAAPRADGYADETDVRHAPFSPAQIIALVIALMFIGLGGVALARTGLGDLFAHTTVAGFDHTMLLGIIELAFGLLMLAAGALPGADRGGMIVLGVLAFGFGLVVAVEPQAFHGALGTHSGNGWLYIVTGAVSLLTAMVAPVFSGASRRERVRVYD